MGFATDAIHAGQEADPLTGAVSVPIYQTSTYVQEALGSHKGFEYARTQNPTRSALEKNLATLESGAIAHCFASGMSAITTLLLLLGKGDHVVVSENTYGGTYRLFEKVLRGFGLDFTYVDASDASLVEQALRPETRLVFLEIPTNPVMTIADLKGVAALTHERGIWLAVDNSSTPAAGTGPQLGIACDAAGTFDAQQELRTYVGFYNLTAGQLVTLRAKVSTNALGNLVNVVYIGGNFRPTAT